MCEVFTFITVKNDLDKFANFYNIPYINTEDKFDNGIDLFFFSKDTNGNYIYDDEHLSYVADQLIFTWKHNEESNQNEIAIIKDSIRDYFNYIKSK